MVIQIGIPQSIIDTCRESGWDDVIKMLNSGTSAIESIRVR